MLPRFSQLFFNQLAKATNARTGHTESVFAPGDRYHALELFTNDGIACKIAYLLGNPAKAGLVGHHQD
jgi:predicted RNA binding protein YcfA (HicA-like mRNA interferase family)